MRKGFDFYSKFIIIGITTFALLSFNWDRTELEGRAFVVAIGIDASDDEDDRFGVSMSIADVAAMEGEGGADDASILRVAGGESLARAMGQIDAKISDKVYYGHTKAVVLGESILQDEGLLREVMDTLSRKNEINIKCIVMATDEAAKDILEAKPREQSLLGLYLSGFYNSEGANPAAAVVKLDLEGLIEGLRDTKGAVIPRVTLKEDDNKDDDSEEEKDKEVAISGVAVLRDFVLAGYVPEEDMAGFLWLMENAAGAQVATEVEEGHITLLVQKSKTKFCIDELDGQLHCTAILHVEGSIEGARFMEDYLYDTQIIKKLQEDFAGKIREEVEDIWKIFQKDLGVDGFGLKELLRKREWPLYQLYMNKKRDDWQAVFEDMGFAVKVDVLIRNTGSVK